MESHTRAAKAGIRQEAWLVTLAATLLYALAAAVLAQALGGQSAWLAAGAAAPLAPVLARLLAPRLTLLTLILVGSALLVMAGLVRYLLLDLGLGPTSLTPVALVRLADAWAFALSALGICLALRSAAWRFPVVRLLEVAAVVAIVALRLAAHRRGLITRPFSLTDPFISRGLDPTWIFYGAGSALSAAVVVLLIRERHLGRWLIHLALAGLLVFLGLELTQLVVSQVGPAGSPFGLQGEGQTQEQAGQGQRPEGDSRAARNKQLDFDNDFSDPSRQLPVAVVNFHTDHASVEGVYYFRQDAFSEFNGVRLVAAEDERFDQDLIEVFPSEGVVPADAPPDSLFFSDVETSVGLLNDHLRPWGLLSPYAMEPLKNANPGRFSRTYRVRSRALSEDFSVLIGVETGHPAWGAEAWQHYLAAPKDPRYRELAQKTVEDLLDPSLWQEPAAQALALRAWLSREGTYSLRSNHADAPDPTASFLFGDLVGYCVHYAHALTFMLRSLGVPARVGTGYAAEEASRSGGSSLLLYGRDAHAWAEVYFTGQGWIPFDVFPQTVRDGRPAPPDADLQRLLGSMLRDEKLGDPLTPRLPDLSRLSSQVRAALLRGFGLVMLMALVVLMLGKAWHRLLPRVPLGSPLRRLYRAALDRLAEVGVRRHFGESREAFAARLGNEPFSELTRLTLEHRFRQPRRHPHEALGALWQHYLDVVRQRYPRRVRILGAFKFWTWLQIR